MLFSREKSLFLWLANSDVKPPYFKISRFKLKKLIKPCWPNKREGWLRWFTCWSNLGLPHIVKAASETWPNPRVNSTLAASFQQEPCWDCDVMSNVNFALSSNSKDQLGDLNKKLITAISTLDGFTLGGDLITSHQVDNMSTTLIPTEAVENNQDYLILIL